MKKLVDMTVTEYIETVASDAPAPGGGSAAALCGAQGAGLAAMVAGLTIGKKKYPLDQELCISVADEGKKLAASLAMQIDRDTEAFNLISAAFRLPKDTDEQKLERHGVIADATLVASEVPFETLQYAHAALILARSLVGHSNANCASDLGVAALNLVAAARGAYMNVMINVPGVEDDARAGELASQSRIMLGECEAMGEEIYRALLAQIEG